MPPWSSTKSDSIYTSDSNGGIKTIALGRSLDLARLQARDQKKYPFLLQSVSSGTHQSRYDMLFAFPEQTLRLDAAQDQVNFLAHLDQLCTATANPAIEHDLPFVGGWFVYLGYELAAQIEPCLQLPQDRTPCLPVAFAAEIPLAIINDNERGEAFIVARGSATAQILEVQRDITKSSESKIQTELAVSGTVTEAPAEEYLDSVTRILKYIKDGDVFQVNLSRLWHLQMQDPVSSHALHAQLCQHNPAPFAANIHIDDAAIISSSPERLLAVNHGRINTRPIAGTRPRAPLPGDDHILSSELLSHPKEQAEHIMLIDLERNDLGKICVPGSVCVNELMTLESYAHVHHIVSNVQGDLREQVTPGQIIAALFPGGTITGCPKVRCMEIIGELENSPRGPYTGSVGYISDNGNMDFNILIRSLVLSEDQVYFRTGAGIVADSCPTSELAETRAKARGLLHALGQHNP